MSDVQTELLLAGAHFGPGEEIGGQVSWRGARAPKSVELRLFWHTKGRGDRDTATIWEKNFEAPLAEERRDFTLAAPLGPPSFSGKLVSLLWSMELVIDGKGVRVEDIVIAPNGIEMELQRPEWIAFEAPWDAPKFPWFKKA